MCAGVYRQDTGYLYHNQLVYFTGSTESQRQHTVNQPDSGVYKVKLQPCEIIGFTDIGDVKVTENGDVKVNSDNSDVRSRFGNPGDYPLDGVAL